MTRQRGFTLVEVLVALLIMAVLAAMAWQGVDGITRARTAGQDRIEQTLRLNTVMTQLEQDLTAVYDAYDPASAAQLIPALTFDGATLRLSRRVTGGAQVVAWSLRGGHWTRWTGPVVTLQSDLQESWFRSQQLLGNEPTQLDAQAGVEAWQVYFAHRNTTGGPVYWSNAQSTGNVVAAPSPGASAPAVSHQQLPAGVRIVLTLTQRGTLTRDLLLSPTP